MSGKQNSDKPNPKLIVHIGLGKTGTTALQSSVFPKVCSDRGWNYRGALDPELQGLLLSMLYEKQTPKIHLNGDTFFSNQGLTSWDPYKWELCADKNLEAFGEDAMILFIIREPLAYLNSVYVQRCLHEANILKPEDFFLSKDRYSRLLPTPTFSLEDFDYNNLISLYKNRFNKVVFIKYESLGELAFLGEFFDLSQKELDEYRRLLRGFRSNPSYSRAAVDLTMKLNTFLNNIGLRLKDSETELAFRYLNKTAERPFLDNAHDGTISSTAFAGKSIRTVFAVLKRELGWRYFMQNRYDKWFKYEKFSVDFSDMKFFDFAKVARDYKSIPDFDVFEK